LLHAPGDPADLARVLGTILDDVAVAARLAGHGHTLARERHSAGAMAAAHESVYEQAMRRGTPGN
jgi:hypothetical protein